MFFISFGDWYLCRTTMPPNLVANTVLYCTVLYSTVLSATKKVKCLLEKLCEQKLETNNL